MPNLDPHKDGQGVTCPTCQGMGWIRLKTMAERLRHARTMRGLTLRQLAEQTGLSNPFISQIETGRVNDVSALRLRKLARALKVSTDWLLGEERPC